MLWNSEGRKSWESCIADADEKWNPCDSFCNTLGGEGLFSELKNVSEEGI